MWYNKKFCDIPKCISHMHQKCQVQILFEITTTTTRLGTSIIWLSTPKTVHMSTGWVSALYRRIAQRPRRGALWFVQKIDLCACQAVVAANLLSATISLHFLCTWFVFAAFFFLSHKATSHTATHSHGHCGVINRSQSLVDKSAHIYTYTPTPMYLGGHTRRWQYVLVW